MYDLLSHYTKHHFLSLAKKIYLSFRGLQDLIICIHYGQNFLQIHFSNFALSIFEDFRSLMSLNLQWGPYIFSITNYILDMRTIIKNKLKNNIWILLLSYTYCLLNFCKMSYLSFNNKFNPMCLLKARKKIYDKKKKLDYLSTI